MEAVAQQKKRRLEDEAQEYNGEYNQMVGPQLPGAERLPDSHRVQILEGKLEHLRSWMKQLAKMMEATNLHAVQNSKRLFVGGLPHDVTQEELVSFLNDCINTSGANVASGNAVVSCRIQQEKNFAFVEVRSAEEATNVIALDGVCLRGEIALKIKRPTKFDSQTAAMLGPNVPDPTIDLRGLIINKPVNTAEHGYQNSGRYERNWNTLYVGGLPIDWTEPQVAELLKNYGQLKYLKLMQDKETGRSRGFAFCEFADEAATTAALQQLNGYQVMGRFITVNRPMEHKAQLSQQQQQQQQQQMGMMGGGMARGMGGGMMGGSAGSGGGMVGSGMGGGVPMQPGLGATGMAGSMGTGMDGYGMTNQGMGMGNQGMGMGGGMQGTMGMGSGQMQQGGMGGYGPQGAGYGSMQQQGDMSGGYNTSAMGGGMAGAYNQPQPQQDLYGGQQGMGMGTVGAAGTQQGGYGAAPAAGAVGGGYNMHQGGYADVSAGGMGGAPAAPAGLGGYGAQPAPPSAPVSNTPKAGGAALAGAAPAAAGGMGGIAVGGMPAVSGAMGGTAMGQQGMGALPQWQQQQQQGAQQQYGSYPTQQPQQQYSSFPGYPGQQQQWQQ